MSYKRLKLFFKVKNLKISSEGKFFFSLKLR
jgi:hypothetical protein